MQEHPNALLVRRCYDAFTSGELEQLRELVNEDTVWHEPGRSPIGGDYKGPEGLTEFVLRLRALCNDSLSVELIDVMVNAERAVAVQRITAEAAGRTLDEIDALDFEIHNGRITEVSVYQQDTYAFDEFWTAAALAAS
jgi:uncharacterized protein